MYLKFQSVAFIYMIGSQYWTGRTEAFRLRSITFHSSGHVSNAVDTCPVPFNTSPTERFPCHTKYWNYIPPPIMNAH